MTPGLGHNNGPTMEPGYAWRKHVWTKARRDLLPTLPIEVVRLRVRRAAELGLPYQTYAGLRASTGDDLVGFLFSNNALRVLRAGQVIPAEVCETLGGLRHTARVAVMQKAVGLDAAQIAQLDEAHQAPSPLASWSDMRDQLKAIVAATGKPADRLVVVGETAFEQEWVGALKAAGYLRGHSYFTPQPG